MATAIVNVIININVAVILIISAVVEIVTFNTDTKVTVDLSLEL